MTALGWVLVGAAALCGSFALGVLVERVHHRRCLQRFRVNLCRLERDLAEAERANEVLLAQVAEALRIIADLSDARVADADDPFRRQWVAPTPQAWAAFQEGREKPGAN